MVQSLITGTIYLVYQSISIEKSLGKDYFGLLCMHINACAKQGAFVQNATSVQPCLTAGHSICMTVSYHVARGLQSEWTLATVT